MDRVTQEREEHSVDSKTTFDRIRLFQEPSRTKIGNNDGEKAFFPLIFVFPLPYKLSTSEERDGSREMGY